MVCIAILIHPLKSQGGDMVKTPCLLTLGRESTETIPHVIVAINLRMATITFKAMDPRRIEITRQNANIPHS